MSLLIKKILQKIKEHENKIQDSGWQNLQFINSWHNGDEQNPAQYRKIGNTVYLQGLIYNGGNNNRNTAQLPTGCFNNKLINSLKFAVWKNGTTIADMQITPQGGIISPSGMSNEEYYSIDGISFLVN